MASSRGKRELKLSDKALQVQAQAQAQEEAKRAKDAAPKRGRGRPRNDDKATPTETVDVGELPVVPEDQPAAPVAPRRGPGRPRNDEKKAPTKTVDAAELPVVPEDQTAAPVAPRRPGRPLNDEKRAPANAADAAGLPIILEEQPTVPKGYRTNNAKRVSNQGKTAAGTRSHNASEGTSKQKHVSRPAHIEALVARFYDDQSIDFVAGAFEDGLADGTLALSETESTGSIKAYDESDQTFILRPITSTPHPKKEVPVIKKGRLTVGERSIKTVVHDGLALRPATISTAEDYSEVLEKISKAMKRPGRSVNLGYEAPWCTKVGSKRCPEYLTSEAELDDFWLSCVAYISKPKNKANAESPGIVFWNMAEEAQNMGKAAGRSTTAKSAKREDHSDDPREMVKTQMTEATQKIQVGMFCHDCNRLCYKTWDNHCRAYTHEYVAEHAKLFVQGVPGVVANKVPDAISSKLLDYKRPGRKRKATDNDGNDDDDKSPDPASNPREKPTSNGSSRLPAREIEVRGYHGPLDFPLISSWLRRCEEDLERGRDRHEYTQLAPVFEANGCTRIDDISRMTPGLIREIAGEAGVRVTIGLVNRVHEYASEDVKCVRSNGKL